MSIHLFNANVQGAKSGRTDPLSSLGVSLSEWRRDAGLSSRAGGTSDHGFAQVFQEAGRRQSQDAPSTLPQRGRERAFERRDQSRSQVRREAPRAEDRIDSREEKDENFRTDRKKFPGCRDEGIGDEALKAPDACEHHDNEITALLSAVTLSDDAERRESDPDVALERTADAEQDEARERGAESSSESDELATKEDSATQATLRGQGHESGDSMVPVEKVERDESFETAEAVAARASDNVMPAKAERTDDARGVDAAADEGRAERDAVVKEAGGDPVEDKDVPEPLLKAVAGVHEGINSRRDAAAEDERGDQVEKGVAAEQDVSKAWRDPVEAPAVSGALADTPSLRQRGAPAGDVGSEPEPDVMRGEGGGQGVSPVPESASSDADAFAQGNPDDAAAMAFRTGRQASHLDPLAERREFSEIAGIDEGARGVNGRPERALAPESLADAAGASDRVEQIQTLVARFGHWVNAALSARGNSMNIHLSPASLGRLSLYCREDHGRLTVEIAAESREARQYLAQHEAEIRSVVQNAGFRMTQFDVHAQSDGQGRRSRYDFEHPRDTDHSGRLARRAAEAAAWEDDETDVSDVRITAAGRKWWVA